MRGMARRYRHLLVPTVVTLASSGPIGRRAVSTELVVRNHPDHHRAGPCELRHRSPSPPAMKGVREVRL